jgi:hypothetical protein
MTELLKPDICVIGAGSGDFPLQQRRRSARRFLRSSKKAKWAAIV